MKKNTQYGGTLLGSMLAMGITLLAFAGFTANKSKMAKIKRGQAARLNYQEFESTFRSSMSKEISQFVFNNMKCEDVGTRSEPSGLPTFLLNGESLTRADVVFQALDDDAADSFDYLNTPQLSGSSVHQSVLAECQGSKSIIGRQTRDGQGQPIIFLGNSLFMCMRITSQNGSSNIWAAAKYDFMNLITGARYNCETFKEKMADPTTVTQLGGTLSYRLMWTEGRADLPHSALIHKGSMIAPYEKGMINSGCAPGQNPITVDWQASTGVYPQFSGKNIEIYELRGPRAPTFTSGHMATDDGIKRIYQFWYSDVEFPCGTRVLEARLRVTTSSRYANAPNRAIAGLYMPIKDNNYLYFNIHYPDVVIMEGNGVWWTDSTIDTRQWHTYRIEADPDEKFRIYVDGTLLKSGQAPSRTFAPPMRVGFGDWTNSASGKVDYKFFRHNFKIP